MHCVPLNAALGPTFEGVPHCQSPESVQPFGQAPSKSVKYSADETPPSSIIPPPPPLPEDALDDVAEDELEDVPEDALEDAAEDELEDEEVVSSTVDQPSHAAIAALKERISPRKSRFVMPERA